MRILLAFDGSPGSSVAARLVETGPWPVGSSVELVTVIEPELAELPVGPWPTPAAAADIAAEDDLARVLAAKAALDEIGAALRKKGIEASTVILRGDPRQLLVDRIERDRPDVVVTGTRDLGGVRRIVLGSVSSALVDRSAVPVLVARGERLERVVVATDGSDVAETAIATVTRWPFLATAEVRVVSVAPDHPIPWPPEMIPGVPPRPIEDVRNDPRDLAEHERIATDAAERLVAAGIAARAQVLTGPAGGAITAFARQWGADLVIMGSHGRTGITRIVLGSVARDVLEHTGSSVLIIRHHAEPVRVTRLEAMTAVHSLATH
jgi:nucleotide-binding universal stress UspA family protein